MKLVTKRLILRDLRMKDVKSIVENVNNLNVSKWVIMVPHPYKLKDAKKWIKDVSKKERGKKRDSYTFGIELKSEKKIIGSIGVHKINKFFETATVGYWLGQKYWRQGYGSEALRVILDFAFRKLKLRRLDATIIKENPSSGKLLEKYGFKKEGMRRKRLKSKATGNRKVYDEVIYGLLKQEYKPRKRI
jgi:ribosomal-protein-alanine N-acetyltransferase